MAVGRANKFGAALAKRLTDVDADEVAYLTDVVAGTVTASKAVIVGANKNINTISIADGGLKLGSGAGTAVTATAAELNILDDATVTTAELNLLDDIVASFSFSASAGASDVCEVAITLKDAAGATVDGARPFMVWLSDAATGVGLTGTTASGTVKAKSASGADFATFTAKKALLVQPLATGVYTLEITDSAKTAFYVCAATLDGRAYSVSTVLATEDYGAGE